MKFAFIAGDGIGVDVTIEALKVLTAVAEVEKLELDIKEFDYGAERYLKTGVALPPGSYDHFKTYDAIYMGAFGDPRVPDMAHAREILLGTRFELDQYINFRPVRCFNDDLCPLKHWKATDIDDRGYFQEGHPRRDRDSRTDQHTQRCGTDHPRRV
jgi:3-isopropylmalate dehydrogenase